MAAGMQRWLNSALPTFSCEDGASFEEEQEPDLRLGHTACGDLVRLTAPRSHVAICVFPVSGGSRPSVTKGGGKVNRE